MTIDARAEAPPPVPGDSKDWTWVLERPCSECGFDGDRYARDVYAATVRQLGAAWRRVLDGEPDALRRRPVPDRWSTLEYACHVRDVFEVFRRRVELMLDDDGVAFANWDQDATAVAERYDLADPPDVAVTLGDNAERLAAVFAGVPGPAWAHHGVRSDGARFTVESIGRYLLHDPIHHLHDVGAA
jgi:DinB superfamily